MKLKLVCAGLGLGLAAIGPAEAQNFSYGAGIKDRIAVPSAVPVPAPVPIPEGFSYYLRADLGWSFANKDPSFTESGRAYGGGPDPFTSLTAVDVSKNTGTDDLFIGTIGTGAYFSPRFRGDLTLDFRGEQSIDSRGDFSYAGSAGGVANGNTVLGSVQDTLKVNSAVALANLYWDLLPRGHFTPYIGAGIGFVYNDIDRRYSSTEIEVDGVGVATGNTQTVSGTSKDTHFGLAAALMAGASFAFDHRWAVDVGYRALYLDGGDVTTTLNNGNTSKVSLGDHWEHQVRAGLRMNIW